MPIGVLTGASTWKFKSPGITPGNFITSSDKQLGGRVCAGPVNWLVRDVWAPGQLLCDICLLVVRWLPDAKHHILKIGGEILDSLFFSFSVHFIVESSTDVPYLPTFARLHLAPTPSQAFTSQLVSMGYHWFVPLNPLTHWVTITSQKPSEHLFYVSLARVVSHAPIKITTGQGLQIPVDSSL